MPWQSLLGRRERAPNEDRLKDELVYRMFTVEAAQANGAEDNAEDGNDTDDVQNHGRETQNETCQGERVEDLGWRKSEDCRRSWDQLRALIAVVTGAKGDATLLELRLAVQGINSIRTLPPTSTRTLKS
jgi:hypothetical protein